MRHYFLPPRMGSATGSDMQTDGMSSVPSPATQRHARQMKTARVEEMLQRLRGRCRAWPDAESGQVVREVASFEGVRLRLSSGELPVGPES